MIRRIGRGKVFKTARSRPIEFTRIHDYAANGGAMAAQKFSGGIDYDVRTPLDGPHQRRRGRSVVDDQWNAVLVSDSSELLDIGDVQLGIAQCLGVNGTGLVIDGRAQAAEVICVNETDRDPEPRKGVVKEVVGAAIERRRGDDFIASRSQGGQGQSLRSLAGGRGQPCSATFKSRHALLENIGGGIHDAGVDIAELLQPEQTGRHGPHHEKHTRWFDRWARPWNRSRGPAIGRREQRGWQIDVASILAWLLLLVRVQFGSCMAKNAA